MGIMRGFQLILLLVSTGSYIATRDDIYFVTQTVSTLALCYFSQASFH